MITCFLAALVLPMAVFAEDNRNAKKGLENIGDEAITSERSKTKLINKVTDKNGKETLTYQTTISSLPTYKDDLVTPISASWTKRIDDSGQVIFKSGDNLFTAQIVGERVTVLDANGKIHAWTSSIMAGKELLTASNPTITADLFNSNYAANCVVWNYGQVKKNGAVEDFFVLNNDSATVQRYIRVIEGLIQEYWVLDKDPGVDLLISVKDNKEANTQGIERPINAYDADGEKITITEEFYKTSGRFYSISKEDLEGKTYPVYIDPDLTFTANAYDGDIANNDVVYNTSWIDTNGSTSSTFSSLDVGQEYRSSKYYIYRSFLYFDTSSIPNAAVISQTQLKLYVESGYMDDGNYKITVQTGGGTYPSVPLNTNDYNKSYYSGDGGNISTSNMATGNYNIINFNSTGLGYVNKTGTTKLCLRSDDDIDGSAPTGSNYVTFYAYEMGIGYQSQLIVTYSVTPSAPTVTTGVASSIGTTSAVLGGTLTSDGRGDPNIPEYCSASFEYGTTTAYGQSSAIDPGYTTGMSIVIPVYGLSKGTLYYFRAKATNSAGSSYGAQGTFLTLPDPPSLLSVAPGNEENVITWTKGEGAVNTMVRFGLVTNPTTISTGSQIYNSTLSTYTHTSLTGGTIYYYSLWSWVTAGGYTQYSSGADIDGTPYSVDAPTISTYDAISVTTTSAVMTGYMSKANQTSGSVTLSIEWDTDSGAPYANDTAAIPPTLDFDEDGSFGILKTGLSNATPYYYRAKAVGTGGTAYGTEKTFTTGGLYAPTITTSAETNVGLTSFTMNGVVTADGGYTDGVTVSFDYGTSTAYGYSTTTLSGYSTGDIFYFTISDLNPSIVYHFRAKGTNVSGTGYGVDESVTTSSPLAPTLTTGSAIDVGSSSATVSGILSNDGGANCEVKFEYGLTTSYGFSTGWQSGKISGDGFEALIEGLNIGDTYHFRAVAKNITATTNGEDANFTTVFDAPTSFGVKAITSTSAAFSWTKNGEQTLIIVKRTGFPTDRTDGDRVYFGPDSKCSFSELTGGNTYFFSAWSWRAGDIWTDTYSEDAVTMPIVMEGETPVAGKWTSKDLTGDSNLYQDKDDTKLQSLPFYGIINNAATDSGIPSTTLWFIVGMTLCIIVTCFASSMFGWNHWIFIIVAIVSMWAVSLTTMIPYWVAILSTILAVLYVVKFKGNS